MSGYLNKLNFFVKKLSTWATKNHFLKNFPFNKKYNITV